MSDRPRRYSVAATFSNPNFWTGAIASRESSEVLARGRLIEIRSELLAGKRLAEISAFTKWLAYEVKR